MGWIMMYTLNTDHTGQDPEAGEQELEDFNEMFERFKEEILKWNINYVKNVMVKVWYQNRLG